MQTVKGAYDFFKVSDVAFILFEFNIGDELVMVNRIFIYLNTMKRNKIDHPVGQWIIFTNLNKVLLEKSGGAWICF